MRLAIHLMDFDVVFAFIPLNIMNGAGELPVKFAWKT